MHKFILALSVAGLVFARPVCAQTYPLAPAKGFELHNAKVEAGTFQGKKAVRVTAAPGERPAPGTGEAARLDHLVISPVKDFSSDNNDTAFLRYVKRWRLERAEPEDPKRPGRLSAPKKKIVFWIEKSVPMEYRAYVREGILEWNKAFEKIGFRDAIEVRQQEIEDFDPEDINYNTFRWITSDQGYAMGPSRANPLTGEILDADIVFDGSMVRYWKQEYQIRTGTGGALSAMKIFRYMP